MELNKNGGYDVRINLNIRVRVKGICILFNGYTQRFNIFYLTIFILF
jgi:hypothetical protein